MNVISLGHWTYQRIAIDVTPFELHIEIGKYISMALSSVIIKPFPNDNLVLDVVNNY